MSLISLGKARFVQIISKIYWYVLGGFSTYKSMLQDYQNVMRA